MHIEIGRGRRRHITTAALALLLGAGLSAVSVAGGASAKSAPRVLYVFQSGSPFAGVTPPGTLSFSSIQAAVTAAHKGDWILVAPGDYHETDDVANPPTPSDLSSGWFGGVDIETPGVHLRGMDRNSVIVDG